LPESRSEVLGDIARRISRQCTPARSIVAVDGVDGAGKTTFADELAPCIESMGRTVIRAGIDGFHNPRAVRYRRGRFDPQSFFLDSFDYISLRQYLIDPFLTGQDVHTARFDHMSDQVVSSAMRGVDSNCVLLLDGIFLHRPELRELWTCSVFLDVPFAVTFARMAVRDGRSSDPADERNRRYFHGQQIYFAQCRPMECATITVDNSDLARPRIVAERATEAGPGR
jgi:uridine kinase